MGEVNVFVASPASLSVSCKTTFIRIRQQLYYQLMVTWPFFYSKNASAVWNISSSSLCLSNGQEPCWDHHCSLGSICTTTEKVYRRNSSQRDEPHCNSPRQPHNRRVFRPSSGVGTACPCRVWMPGHTEIDSIHCVCPLKSIEILTAILTTTRICIMIRPQEGRN